MAVSLALMIGSRVTANVTLVLLWVLSLMLEFWKRRQHYLALEWGMTGVIFACVAW